MTQILVLLLTEIEFRQEIFKKKKKKRLISKIIYPLKNVTEVTIFGKRGFALTGAGISCIAESKSRFT